MIEKKDQEEEEEEEKRKRPSAAKRFTRAAYIHRGRRCCGGAHRESNTDSRMNGRQTSPRTHVSTYVRK